MELFELLQDTIVNEEICKYLSFGDAINLQKVFGKSRKFRINIQERDVDGCIYTFSKVTQRTILVFESIKKKGAKDVFFDFVHQRQIANIETLLEIGVNIDTRGFGDVTALILGSERNNPELVEFLLAKGANINIVDRYEHTALSYACSMNHLEIVLMLLRKGANVNYATKSGKRTDLMWSAQNGYIELTQILLERGAEVNLVSKYGETALSLAMENNKKAVAELLRTYGAK